MRKLSLILILALILCGFAFAEEETALTPETVLGVWNLEYVLSDGINVNAAAYGLVVTLTLEEDGKAVMTYAGEEDPPMSWRIEDGKCWITGYSDSDVELVVTSDIRCEIVDSVGEMHFRRPAEAAE